MKLKNEVRIALVAIAGIVVLFFGMQFLKGLDIFSSEYPYLMKFSNISGLSASSPIYADGFRVGTVNSIDYDYNKHGDITVEVSINKEMQIPEGTSAEIVSDVLGNVQVNLILGKEGAGKLNPGDVIDGRINNGALGDMKDMIPTVQKMLPKLDSILASVNTLLADPALASSLHNVDRITSDLTTSTRELNRLLANVNNEFPRLSAKTENLMDKAGKTVTNANTAITTANTTMTTINGKMAAVDVEATMAKVDKTLANVQTLTDKINNGEGSLGLLINDASLYNNLTNTVRNADSLVVNLREHPKRYVHFSIFGKKDK